MGLETESVNNKNFTLTYDELFLLLKEAYRNGYATYEITDAGLEPYDADGYARWVLLGLNEKHVENFGKFNKDLTIKVKHLIKYLKDNFDDEAKVLFEHRIKPECLEEYPVDAIDYLDKLGTFQNYKGDLWINN